MAVSYDNRIAVQSGRAAVVVMQATQHWEGDELALSGWGFWFIRDPLTETLMGSSA
jgi:hypothetical protein